ncbi:MarR family transcriptional regulator [Metabacillus fastidiosus]|uniref:MarR family winged helix-turn-helix transcriptional regulator n=1 Tax=Metabacillus fastidiosus TaxID=1458 RepID=UPI003D278FB4
MKLDPLQLIEYEIALLVRLTTAHSPRLGSLDRSEYLILCELDENGPLAINVLAEKLMLNISTASRQVGVLETKKYIHRYPDPNNGRISLMEITQEGQDILIKVQKARYAVYKEILQEWSEEELKQLENNLTRLNRDFKKWGN